MNQQEQWIALSSEEEEATHVRIMENRFHVPVTIGAMYELKIIHYGAASVVRSERYIIDDNGADNFSFALCCKKEFYKKRD
ncbi:hypothetical protein [Paenibacillus massiliensis]|uniref:hypothetical protein n=1 Tax=Paenibacillus massiliensis TaxID=225917 RepID=UPI000365F256|nr:hypothetical protein [Paenibacillus massiliensis]